jgi:hypothetical protein
MAQQEPRKVKTIPEGYNKEVRDGKTVYVKKTEKPIPDKGKVEVKAPSVKKKISTGTPSPAPKVKPTIKVTPPAPKKEFGEDVLMLEEITPTPIVKPQSLRTDLKEEFPSGLQKGFHQYQVPDLNTGGNYTKAKTVITDSTGIPHVYDFKQNKYIPTGEPTIHSNMPVQNDTPTIQAPLKAGELPTKFGTVPERLRTTEYNTPKIIAPVVDTTQYKGFNQVGQPNNTVNDIEFKKQQESNLATPKFKKGGLINKVMGYAIGGNINFNESTGNQIGVIGQNDPYATKVEDEKQKTLMNEATKKTNKINYGKTGVDAAGALGGMYYATRKSENSGDVAYNQGMQAVGQFGGIGKVIQGVAAVGDAIGDPVRKNAESYDKNTGKYNNINSAKSAGAIGSHLNPYKSLTTIMTDKDASTETKLKAALTGGAEGTGSYYKDKEAARKLNIDKQIEEAKRLGAVSREEQALANRDAGLLNVNTKSPFDPNKAQFDENGNLIPQMNKGGLLKKIYGYADGGVIKGKGTGKSDSISAKVKAGSFIVPAENAKVAEVIREKVLLKAPKVKANLNQKGGQEVRLSNGEHSFTPEEKEEIKEAGIDVNKLAPKSESKDYMQFPNLIGYEKGGLVKGSKVGNVTWDGKNWIDASGNKYSEEAGKKFTDKYNADTEKQKTGDKQKQQSELKVYTRKYNEAKEKGDIREAAGLLIKINKLQGKEIDIKTGKTKSDESVPAQAKTGLKAPKIKSEANTYSAPSTEPSVNDDVTVPVAQVKVDDTQAAADAKALNDSAFAADYRNNPLAPKPQATQRKGLSGLLGKIDPTMIAGIGQTALGLNYLRGSKRPEDTSKLDGTFDANVNRAQADAQFGFTPEQQIMLEQSRKNAENDARYSARNFSGGNAGNAFNQERAAINQGWMNKLGIANEDQQLRMQKQQYADQQVKDRASNKYQLSRTAFTDALGAFQQKQQAGSELIGAGIQNTIGALRYQQELDAMAKSDAQKNAWMGNI